MDLPRDPVQRGLARAIGREVQCPWRKHPEASPHRANGDEARQHAGFEHFADGLEEYDGAEDVDLVYICKGRGQHAY